MLRAPPDRASLVAGTCVDSVVIGHLGLASVWPFLWGMLGVFAARAVVALFADSVAFEAAAAVKQKLRGELNRKIAALGPGFVADRRPDEFAGGKRRRARQVLRRRSSAN